MKDEPPAASVHDVQSLSVFLAGAMAFAKRCVLQASQAGLDVSIYLGCLELVLSLWVASPGGFIFERKVFFCGVLFICFAFRGLYQFRTWTFWDEMREVLKASAAMFLILAVSMYALKLYLSRVALCAGVMLFVPTCLAARYLLRRAAFAVGLLRTPILIIGSGSTGALYAKKVATHPFMGCKAVAFLDDDPEKTGGDIFGIPVLGRVEDFPAIQRELRVAEVVVAIPTAKRDMLVRILDAVEMRVKSVSYIPDMYMLTTFSASIRDVDGLPLISASQGLLNPMNRLLKSLMDYVGSLLALVIFSPVFLYVAWRIKRDDGGVVFFKHNRIGRNLIPIKIYKFRTMVPDAEKKLQEMLKDDDLRREYEMAFKFKDDKRITKAGHFLRKSSLDEVPQLFNVLKGQMSLVGPRPIVKKEVELYYGEEVAKQIFRVKPGLTGLWQVSGRNDVDDYQHRVELDMYYIRNWSPWLDLVIMMRTLQVLLNAAGAY